MRHRANWYAEASSVTGVQECNTCQRFLSLCVKDERTSPSATSEKHLRGPLNDVVFVPGSIPPLLVSRTQLCEKWRE